MYYSIIVCLIQASTTTLKCTDKSSTPQESKKKEMVTVTKVFDFAGEKVRYVNMHVYMYQLMYVFRYLMFKLISIMKLLMPSIKFIQIGEYREYLISWICSFISGRQQCVRYNQTLSDCKKLNGEGGLPQGTEMGPLGFQVIINDAASDADTNVWKYVDDLTLASNVSNLAKSTLQEDLHNFVDWSKNNNLTLNPSKCQGL